MVIHSLNIFLVSNLSALKFLSSLLYLFLICRSSLGKILLEGRCCFHCSLSAMSSKDLKNRILFPASPLLPSMKTLSPCLMWKSWMLLLVYWLLTILLRPALNFYFCTSSSLPYKNRVFNFTNAEPVFYEIFQFSSNFWVSSFISRFCIGIWLSIFRRVFAINSFDFTINGSPVPVKDSGNFRNFVIFF